MIAVASTTSTYAMISVLSEREEASGGGRRAPSGRGV